jgi:hypothetical protein
MRKDEISFDVDRKKLSKDGDEGVQPKGNLGENITAKLFED